MSGGVPVLVKTDPESGTRQTAAWSLGQIGDRQAVEALIGALHDESGGVRSTAAWSLGILGDHSASSALQDVLGDADESLGDSMYDGTIYVGGTIKSLGVDAVPGEMTELEATWLERKLAQYGLRTPKGIESMQKVVSGKKLWNNDQLEPSEKKLVL